MVEKIISFGEQWASNIRVNVGVTGVPEGEEK